MVKTLSCMVCWLFNSNYMCCNHTFCIMNCCRFLSTSRCFNVYFSNVGWTYWTLVHMLTLKTCSARTKGQGTRSMCSPKNNTCNGLKLAEWARAFFFKRVHSKQKLQCFSRSKSLYKFQLLHNGFCRGYLTCLCHLWLTQTTRFCADVFEPKWPARLNILNLAINDRENTRQQNICNNRNPGHIQGILGDEKTHKYPLYRAYIGISHDRVHWNRGTSLPIPWPHCVKSWLVNKGVYLKENPLGFNWHPLEGAGNMCIHTTCKIM